jgi:hypothetical protein
MVCSHLPFITTEGPYHRAAAVRPVRTRPYPLSDRIAFADIFPFSLSWYNTYQAGVGASRSFKLDDYTVVGVVHHQARDLATNAGGRCSPIHSDVWGSVATLGGSEIAALTLPPIPVTESPSPLGSLTMCHRTCLSSY